MNQVSGDEELLNTAKDYFHFVTKFFEPINISAVHIYHSALELSPLSSIVRRLYYHRQHTPFPRVVAGIPEAWEECVRLYAKPYYHTYTWSPCGRFVAARARGTVDIRDPLSSELLSTLTQYNFSRAGPLAYSPDGYSLASPSGTSLTIWDIQTGGVTREIECGTAGNISLAWSLDGATICAMACPSWDWSVDVMPQLLDYSICNYIVNVYDVASGSTLSSGTLQSKGKPHLWAHNVSFRVITMEQGDRAFTIETFEVGSILTKVESFHIKSWGKRDRIRSFSPTTYRISIFGSACDHLRILDVRKSECLLGVPKEGRNLDSGAHSFSSDGSLFAASLLSGVHIWKYTSGCYALWREFPSWTASILDHSPPQFSPALSSILGCHGGPLQLWRLDSPPIAAHPDSRKSLAVISHCGTCIATGYVANGIVTITNLLSQAPPQFIDTGMYVHALAFTGNVFLVWGDGELVAWRFTERGIVDGASVDRRADRSNSIWTVSTSSPTFFVEDQTVVIKDDEGNIIHVYHTGTGEILALAQVSPHPHARQYSPLGMQRCRHYLHYCDLVRSDIPSEGEWPITQAALEQGWVKDLEGKRRLWIPAEWRVRSAGWLRNTTLLLYSYDVDAIVMF